MPTLCERWRSIIDANPPARTVRRYPIGTDSTTMKFTIADVLRTTTSVAILFSILRYGADGLIIAFALLNFLQIALPVGILFAIIVFADQRRQMLDFSTLPGWQSIKKIWVLSIACTVFVWLCFFGMLALGSS